GSALDASRTMHLIGSFSDQQNELVQEYEGLEARLVSQRAQVAAQKRNADVMLASAHAKVDQDSTQIAHAHVRLTATVLGIMQFEQAATSASSPILGPSLLSAQQLADFVRALGFHPRITVPLDELAQDYITEGEAAGVRGEVQTWWDLWGTWATGAFYGQRVYDIYERMATFAKTDPPHPPLLPTTPVP